MPIKQEKNLNKESDRQEINSVYDFLYHDVNRIGSFLAQFDPYGHLKSLTRSKSVSDNTNSTTNYNTKLQVPFLGEAGSSGDIGAQETISDNSAKTYDPLWQNSLALLDYLHQRKMINRNISQSSIGQFILFSGKLFLFNMAFLQKLAKGKLMRQSIIHSVTLAGTPKNPVKTGTAKNAANLGMELFDNLPGLIQARLISDDFNVWATLPCEGLSISIDDLFLKHGPSISGTWSMLGILDALPHQDESFDHLVFEGFQKGLLDLSKDVKPHFGRPSDYYGVMPLLVFREVSGC